MLLGDVRWRGKVVSGDRPRALLAALAEAGCRPVSDERLVELVWGDERPADEAKSLQVLVSRTRAVCGADAISRDGAGYRLGVGPEEVDSLRLASLVRQARAEVEADPGSARALALEALVSAEGLPSANGCEGVLAAVRTAAVADAAAAEVVMARAASRVGAHAEALPMLEAAHAASPHDESLLVDLLRSEAVVRGPGAALERFESYRRDLRETLGVSPGEQMRRVQRELLALDRPERKGVRHDPTSLVGRDGDIEALRGLLASSRVVSIVGAGGLGKTRLAHVLAAQATQPVVHVVELVGITSPEDVVPEVGSVLGVRDSVSGRRALSAAQRADIRGRLAQRFAQAPSLLVLDNCEHLVGAVADLVGFLVSEAPDLRVLTTSRAPVAIAAERVYLLGELDVSDAAELLRERALAVRADVRFDDDVVERVVVRLDGLPLAIELAAAKVRAMSVEEIDRRLENRFALLRGGNRSAPDRHQTLLAVIDWSWNLLDQTERTALSRLSLYNDGFTLEAAEAMLGDDALRAVQGLVDQSLLAVRETSTGVRYRMLETVREFGSMQLVDTGEDGVAYAKRRQWAVAYASRHAAPLFTPDQFSAIDAVAAEEVNLTDELRDAISDSDAEAVTELLTALGVFWTVRGEHARLLVLLNAVAELLGDWTPPVELEDAARTAAAITVTNAMMIVDERSSPLRRLLTRLGPGDTAPRIAGLVRVLLAYDPDHVDSFESRLAKLAEDPDPFVAQPACTWLSHVHENAGDPAGAVEAAQRALALSGLDTGPWSAAMLHNQLAGLTMHLGDRRTTVEHAQAALPVMERVGAKDDEVQLRSLLALCAISDGRLQDAAAELQRIEAIDDADVFGGIAIRRVSEAELAIARGDHSSGLHAHRDAAAHMRELRFPGIDATGVEPWVVFGESTALTAHAHYADGADTARGWELFASCRDRTLRLLDPGDPQIDCPVAGGALFGLGSWSLLREAAATEDAVRLLVLAERLAYNRIFPTMAWERIAPIAEERAPGLLETTRIEYDGRTARELLPEARDVVARLAI